LFVTYLRRELHRRMRQTVAIALDLALGVGLVIIVSAVSVGLRDAQGTVLRTLYGVGSELTVTQAPSGGPPSSSPSPSLSPPADSRGTREPDPRRALASGRTRCSRGSLGRCPLRRWSRSPSCPA
jgi:putative ABC transport system permease protein